MHASTHTMLQERMNGGGGGRSVSDVLRAQSRFVKFVGGGGWGRRPNPLHILQTYFGSEVRQKQTL